MATSTDVRDDPRLSVWVREASMETLCNLVRLSEIELRGGSCGLQTCAAIVEIRHRLERLNGGPRVAAEA